MLFIDKMLLNTFNSKVSPTLILFTGIMLLGLFVVFPFDMLILCMALMWCTVLFAGILTTWKFIVVGYAKLMKS